MMTVVYGFEVVSRISITITCHGVIAERGCVASGDPIARNEQGVRTRKSL